jgi:hypothetical protein
LRNLKRYSHWCEEIEKKILLVFVALWNVKRERGKSPTEAQRHRVLGMKMLGGLCVSVALWDVKCGKGKSPAETQRHREAHG